MLCLAGLCLGPEQMLQDHAPRLPGLPLLVGELRFRCRRIALAQGCATFRRGGAAAARFGLTAARPTHVSHIAGFAIGRVLAGAPSRILQFEEQRHGDGREFLRFAIFIELFDLRPVVEGGDVVRTRH